MSKLHYNKQESSICQLRAKIPCKTLLKGDASLTHVKISTSSNYVLVCKCNISTSLIKIFAINWSMMDDMIEKLSVRNSEFFFSL